MIEMKSAEHKDCFTIVMFFPPFMAPLSPSKSVRRPDQIAFVVYKRPRPRGTLDFTLGGYVPLGWNP